jgi:hypothetical protein
MRRGRKKIACINGAIILNAFFLSTAKTRNAKNPGPRSRFSQFAGNRAKAAVNNSRGILGGKQAPRRRPATSVRAPALGAANLLDKPSGRV